MKTSVFKGLFVGFGSAFALLLPGLDVARVNSKMVSEALGAETYKIINNEDASPEASNYFPSSYQSLEEVTATGVSLSEKIEAEGLVLLKNDSHALPLSMNSPKVSLFGDGAMRFNYTPSLSGGSVNVDAYKNLKTALEGVGCSVNGTLWDYYKNHSSGGRTNSVDKLVKTYLINETPWNQIESANASTFAAYGDAAIVVFTRDSGEGFDLTTKGSDGRNGTYLGLSNEETALLQGLTAAKKAGTFQRIVVLLNSSCPIELHFLDDASIDVDSILWVGNAGGYGLEAVAKTLVGRLSPSGKLSDTFVKDALSSPAMASWASSDSGVFAQEYEGASAYGLSSVNKHYGVYVEGIYVGYRYYETRYEDAFLNRGNAGSYNYEKEVAYPFGHGLSYASFEYRDLAWSKNDADGTFTATVTVKNTGTVSGREVVQIYGQKPYIAGGIEKSAIELMGFAKTSLLSPDGTETLTITIDKERFKSYDAGAAKTYVLDPGDYYLALGHNAHDALNNILAKKGAAVGDASYAEKAFTLTEKDVTTYAKSKHTGNAISNQLDQIDINTYAGRGDNSVTYVSRNNWEGTFPKGRVVLTVNDAMAADLASHKPIVEEEGLKDITYASGGGNRLINLRGLPFDNPMWDSLLDQMTYEEQSLLLTNGAFGTSTIGSISLVGTKASDGPNFITSTKTNVALPSEGIWASSFDPALLQSIGEYLGEDARINGIDTLYAPGVNIHRTPFIGRSHEYFSEDPYLSAVSVEKEIRGFEGKGVVATVKHFAFNDEDSARNGISIWLNEQSAREIYLLPFEYAMGKTYANGHGAMSGFNRAGALWIGASNALQNVIARDEWGFEGYFVTDMASSNGTLYMTFDDGIMAGTDLYLGAGSKTSLKAYKSSLTFKTRVRNATHRLLYVIVNYSCAMNGTSADTIVVPITPWWDTVLSITTYSTLGLSIAFLALAIFFGSKSRKRAG
ncbi:MAG: glycoside hydrolase family 3 C-terminal domain-containing protein [Bacilli bacterium]|nr:glycoside hydrolase family 3 C-terminal domain-containing protein [Bacilli bacterium]